MLTWYIKIEFIFYKKYLNFVPEDNCQETNHIATLGSDVANEVQLSPSTYLWVVTLSCADRCWLHNSHQEPTGV